MSRRDNTECVGVEGIASLKRLAFARNPQVYTIYRLKRQFVIGLKKLTVM